MNNIYMDYNATTKVDSEVIQATINSMANDFGNPSSSHQNGEIAQDMIEEARDTILTLINGNDGKLVFTSGGTESNNLALFGLLENYRGMQNHIIVSAIEHPAILNIAQKLKEENLCDVSIVPVDKNGYVDTKTLQEELREETRIVSVMMVNNITGIIQNIKEIAEIVHTYSSAIFHSDCVQACGKVSIDVKEMGIDMCSISSHKFHGPKGIGALYLHNNIELKNRIIGGGQERGLRSGTENVPGIVGMGTAANLYQTNFDLYHSHCKELKELFITELSNEIPEAVLLSPTKHSVPSTVTVSIPSLRGQAIVDMMNCYGVSVSACSACSSNGEKVTCPPLLAMGFSEEVAKGAVRFSFGRYTETEEIMESIKIFKNVSKKLTNTLGN